MQSLKDVVAALRAEIEAGLAVDRPLPYGAQLQADRIVATLQFCITETSGAPGLNAVSFSVPSGEGKGVKRTAPIHSLAIEFTSVRDGTNGNAVLQKSDIPDSAAKPVPPAAVDHVTRQLSSLFGPPSFDSAARATVFREAFENLSSAEVEVLMGSLRGSILGQNDVAVKRSLSLLNRVLKSGPAGPVEGKAILAELLARHPLKTIINSVATIWKSQEDWMS